MEDPVFVRCNNLVKIYRMAGLEVVALQGLHLEISRGEIIAIVGPSGAGKSTLLNVIGGLDTPSAGSVSVGGVDLLGLSGHELDHYKRSVVGFMWQQPGRNLLPYLSARENIEMPMLVKSIGRRQRHQQSAELLEMVGMSDRAHHRPDRLSGGQQQRIALAIALANHPALLLTDEPTGQIDSQTANQIYGAIRMFNQQYGTTVIIVTHDPQVVSKVDRVVAISDGRISVEVRRLDDEGGAIQDEEWVVVDQSGQMQIPRPFMETLGLHKRVKVRLEPDHISVWPRQATKGMEEVPDDTPAAHIRFIPRESPEEAPAVVTTDLCRDFVFGQEVIRALRNVSLTIPAGSLSVIAGPSGSGKTTLLNLIAGLDDPTAGTVQLNGQPLERLTEREKNTLRREKIGFVHQTSGMLLFLTVEENVQVPLRLLKVPGKERQTRSRDVLEQVGLLDHARHRAFELSGGEKQRSAIARALVTGPSIILADEPTGQLDSITGRHIIDLFRSIVNQTGITVIIASHDPKVNQAADRVIALHDGRITAPEDSVLGVLDENSCPL